MNIRFYNARILTMEEPLSIFTGEIHVTGTTIAYVGEAKTTDIKWDREIDCKGNLLMPGFKDAHTHSAMTVFRSLADDMPLQEWLTTKIFPAERNFEYEDIYNLTKLAVMEYLTSGITAAMEMYINPYAIADAFSDCGFRNVQVCDINKFGPTLEVMEQRYNDLNNKNDLCSYMMGLHAEYTCEKELMESIAALARKYKAPVFMHNSETKLEVEECVGRYGVTPTVFFDSIGMFEYGGGGYHMVHVSDDDIEVMKKRGLYAVTNPASNLKLASGIAPVARFLEEGIPVAIGTDGPGSNNCLDMFREMFLVTALSKYRENDAACCDANEVLKMATVNGAKAMGLNDCCYLLEGSKADIIMIDLNQPNMQPLHNITKNIVYSGSKQNVKLTMINGKILYEDGKFDIGIGKEELFEKCSGVAKKLGL